MTSFLDFLSKRSETLKWIFINRCMLMSYWSCLNIVLVQWFYLWCLLNLENVFHKFIFLNALKYWSDILYAGLYWWITHRGWVLFCFVNFLWRTECTAGWGIGVMVTHLFFFIFSVLNLAIFHFSSSICFH